MRRLSDPARGGRAAPTRYCNFTYSALAWVRMGMSGSGALPLNEEVLVGAARSACGIPDYVSATAMRCIDSRLDAK